MISAKASLLWTRSPDCGQETHPVRMAERGQGRRRRARPTPRRTGVTHSSFVSLLTATVSRHRRQWRKWRRAVMSIAAPRAVGRGEDLRVAQRAAGLDDRRHAGVEQDLGTVGEREERVRRGDRAAGARRARGAARPSRPPAGRRRPGSPAPSRARRAGRRGRARSRSRRRRGRGARRGRGRRPRGRVGAARGQREPLGRVVDRVVRRADEDRAAGRSGPSRGSRRGCRPSGSGAVGVAGRGSGPRRGAGSASWRGPRAPPARTPGATTTSRKISVSAVRDVGASPAASTRRRRRTPRPGRPRARPATPRGASAARPRRTGSCA